MLELNLLSAHMRVPLVTSLLRQSNPLSHILFHLFRPDRYVTIGAEETDLVFIDMLSNIWVNFE